MIRILLLISASVGVLLLLLGVAGVSPFEVAKSFMLGGFGVDLDRGIFVGWSPISEVLRRTAPLVITGTAVYLALQAGLFNIGAEGQLRMGGLAAIWAALTFGLEGGLGVVVCVGVGVIAGMLWSAPAGLIKAYRGGHEVITTIMLNFVAVFFAKYVISGPLQAEKGGESATAVISEGMRLATLGDPGGFVIYPALLVGGLLCFGLGWWLYRTPSGFEFRACGLNPVAASFAGANLRRVLVWGMVFSGAIAGLAGGLHALGQEHRYTEGFSPGFGFDSLGVALLAGRSPLGILPAAAFFAWIDQGAVQSQINNGLPKEISTVILGLVIFVAAVMRWQKKVSE